MYRSNCAPEPEPIPSVTIPPGSGTGDVMNYTYSIAQTDVVGTKSVNLIVFQFEQSFLLPDRWSGHGDRAMPRDGGQGTRLFLASPRPG